MFALCCSTFCMAGFHFLSLAVLPSPPDSSGGSALSQRCPDGCVVFWVNYEQHRHWLRSASAGEKRERSFRPSGSLAKTNSDARKAKHGSQLQHCSVSNMLAWQTTTHYLQCCHLLKIKAFFFSFDKSHFRKIKILHFYCQERGKETKTKKNTFGEKNFDFSVN